MKLSIIVPVYNMEADGKLNYCIASLLKQTISDYEIIMVDDCSTDGSYHIMTEYARQNPNKCIVAKTTQNSKQGAARNIGLKLAKGEWIGFMDSDDWASPTMYERLLTKAEDTGADVVGCDYTMVNTHTMQPGKTVMVNTQDQTGVLGADQYKKIIMRPGSMVIKIYKSDVIRRYDLHFPENIFYEDNAMGPFWMLHFKHFEKVDEPLYYYYQFEQSTVHTISERRCEDRLTAGNLLVDLCEQEHLADDYLLELEFRYTEIYYMNTLFTYMIGVKKIRLAFLKKMQKEMKKRFPHFQENPYYQMQYDAEQKKLMHMHMKSCTFFVFYYKTLIWFRKTLRK